MFDNLHDITLILGNYSLLNMLKYAITGLLVLFIFFRISFGCEHYFQVFKNNCMPNTFK